MDDIGNIVYLLFVLISIVGGVWQNYNKKKQEAKTNAPSVGPVIEDVVQPMEDFDLDEKPSSEKAQQARLRLEEMRRKAAEAKSNRRIRRKSSPIKVEDVSAEGSVEIDLKDFDARKAVIYSEILNPPYL